MITRNLAFTLSLLLPISTAALADERPPFVGKYSQDCGPDFQCWLEIDQQQPGDSYLAVFIQADRQNFDDFKPCTFPLLMHFAGDRLVKESVQIENAEGGAVQVSGFKPDACKVPLNGRFEPVGD